MKKYILSVAFLFAVLITPMAQVQAQVKAAGLTPVQLSAIVSLLQSFGVDQSVINTIQTSLNGGATTQQSQSTYPSGCTSPFGFSTTTSLRCDGSTPVQNLGGSVTSVASAVNAPTYPSGCTSLVGYSTTTSFRCDGSTPSTPTINTTKSSYTTSESLSGSIVGGDPNHTWSCIQRALNTDPAAQCNSAPWRLLGSSTDIAAGSAGWNLIGGTLSLQALPLAPFPPDTYTMYVRTGTSGPSSHASFTLTAAQGTVAPSAVTSTVAGCENGNLYNTKTGVLCSTTSTVAGCAPGALFSATTAQACSGTTTNAPSAVTLSAVHLTSLFPSSGPVGTTVTINASGLLGTNNIYLNGIPVDTLSTSGTLPPTWISFGIPPQLPYCSGSDRLCAWGPALTPGTYTVRVQNTNGTSNSINFIVFSIDGNGNGSPSGPGVGGGTGIGGTLGTVIGTLTDAMAALSAAITGTPSIADTNVALANAMSNAEVALSEAHDSMSAANVATAADAVAAAADAAAAAGIAANAATTAAAAISADADAAAALGLGTAANSPDSGVAPGDGTGGGDSPGSAVGTW